MTSADHLTKITTNDGGDFNVPHERFHNKINFSMSKHYIHNIEIFFFNFTNKMQHIILKPRKVKHGFQPYLQLKKACLVSLFFKLLPVTFLAYLADTEHLQCTSVQTESSRS